MRASVAAAAAVLLCGCGSREAAPAPDDGGPDIPAVAPDPATQGAWNVGELEYDFGRITVSDGQSGASYETDVRGYVRYATDAPGRLPVVVLLHGRHQTCETGLGQAPVPVGDDNCPPLAPVIAPADSYRGYDYLAARLASHGYAVVSIDANDINDNDGSASAGDAGALARGELVLHHLDELREVDANGGQGLDALQGHLDLAHIGLMGHSRGGEGVARAATLNATRAQPHAIEAVFALAPTDYNGQRVADAAYATLLPYCDGDVENLMGAYVYDASRGQGAGPRLQILAMGANHNYFNTVWTSDDWMIHGSATEPHCGEQAPTSQRDTPEGQRALGEFFMASFFRHYVGHEPAFAAYWSGHSRVPASACPDGVGPCEARYHLSIDAAAPRQLALDLAAGDDALERNALDLPVRLEGFSDAGLCTATGADGGGCPVAEPTFSTATQLYLSWDGPSRYVTDLDGLDASAYDTLSLRVGVSHGDAANAGSQDFGIALTDATSLRAVLAAADHGMALFDPPGNAFDAGGAEKTTLNALRLPLSAFAGIDLTRLQSLELVFDRTPAGTVQIADLSLQRLLP